MVDWSRYRVAGHGMTLHAAERMVEMGIGLEELEACLRFPQVTYEQTGYGPGAKIHKRGRISVAVGESADGDAIVKSVLWNTRAVYQRDQR